MPLGIYARSLQPELDEYCAGGCRSCWMFLNTECRLSTTSQDADTIFHGRNYILHRWGRKQNGRNVQGTHLLEPCMVRNGRSQNNNHTSFLLWYEASYLHAVYSYRMAHSFVVSSQPAARDTCFLFILEPWKRHRPSGHNLFILLCLLPSNSRTWKSTPTRTKSRYVQGNAHRTIVRHTAEQFIPPARFPAGIATRISERTVQRTARRPSGISHRSTASRAGAQGSPEGSVDKCSCQHRAHCSLGSCT
jgi:hypothetical protein